MHAGVLPFVLVEWGVYHPLLEINMAINFRRGAAFSIIGLFIGNAHADAKQEVLTELVFCMSFYNGMSTVVSGASKGKMEAVRDAFAVLAGELSADPATLKSALVATADRAAGEVVGTSAAQRLATSKKCAPWLADGAVQKEIAARTEKN
jgi:hypothetical protein